MAMVLRSRKERNKWPVRHKVMLAVGVVLVSASFLAGLFGYAPWRAWFR